MSLKLTYHEDHEPLRMAAMDFNSRAEVQLFLYTDLEQPALYSVMYSTKSPNPGERQLKQFAGKIEECMKKGLVPVLNGFPQSLERKMRENHMFSNTPCQLRALNHQELSAIHQYRGLPNLHLAA